MAYHPNATPNFIVYRSSDKGGGWGSWSLGKTIEKLCTVCRKRGDSRLRVIVDDLGNVDLGACMWCKTHSVGCSTTLHHHQGGKGKAKAKADKESRGSKQTASEVEDSNLFVNYS
jgi:hypothetical protein